VPGNSQSDDLELSLRQGLERHGAGDLRQAEQIYRRILREKPDHPGALHYLGVIALQLGRADAAVDLIGRAVSARPDDVDALTNLGNALQAAGRSKDAIDSFGRALALRPGSAAILANLGSALAQSGDARAALEHYESALRIDPTLSETRRALADALLSLGRPTEALRQVRQAADENPASLAARVSMGNILNELGKADEAIACFESILAVQPDFAPVLCNLGNVLRQAGRLQDAIDAYNKAIMAQPDYAEGHFGLGTAYRDLGDADRASESFRQTISLDPHFTRAWRALSRLAKEGLSEADIVTMREALDSNAYSADERAHLEFALGQSYENSGDYGRAMQHYDRGNQLRRASFDYSIEQDAAVFDNLKATFDTGFFERWQDVGSDDATPIFIVGMPRSGTTLVEQILASHRDVHGAGELSALARAIAERFAMRDGVDYTEALRSATAEDLRHIAGRYLEAIRELDPKSPRITDKLPNNFLNSGLIRLLFPRATIVHCIRDARDTCFSIYKHDFSAWGHNYAYDQEELGRYYKLYAGLMAHWNEVLPGALYPVKYEELVENQEECTRALLEACSLPWDPACLDFHTTDRPVATLSASQVRRPIYRDSVGAWRKVENSLQVLLRTLDS
jgi:tetratricopeptide (TPR) repeat protein